MLRPLAPSILLFLTLACQPESKEPEAPPDAELAGKNLIVITLDTARQDHFSCYGNPEFRGTTPHIDDLAADGSLFLNGYSQTNTTNPSHAVIFTGLYALDLEVMNNQVPLPAAAAGVDTLPAAFRRANYRTAAFPAVPHLSTLDIPGFDESMSPQAERNARESVDLFLDWVEGGATGPFFAWLHLFDPHVRYEPPERYRTRFYSGDPTRGEGAKLSTISRFEKAPPVAQEQFGEVRDRAYPRAMYRGEIQYTDDQIGRLISALKERGLYEDTAIVLVGDHGESLGEQRNLLRPPGALRGLDSHPVHPAVIGISARRPHLRPRRPDRPASDIGPAVRLEGRNRASAARSESRRRAPKWSEPCLG